MLNRERGVFPNGTARPQFHHHDNPIFLADGTPIQDLDSILSTGIGITFHSLRSGGSIAHIHYSPPSGLNAASFAMGTDAQSKAIGYKLIKP
jgi:hypothetical protein